MGRKRGPVLQFDEEVQLQKFRSSVVTVLIDNSNHRLPTLPLNAEFPPNFSQTTLLASRITNSCNFKRFFASFDSLHMKVLRNGLLEL
ncbi:uncharacterized protein LOC124886390 isoform X3 [Capsicum annuum]|uniref:uncharacterized protein LOC124886390 isoform X3 n=1 Tax=Capsicum annuum TaxID=4072 RepID=UPI001FB0B2FF|nr:uncharacterized protein LOC124886390 isoform X3 [Capsicum annuum]XP_047250397.1 uncharacterized protein LOC124886390 isoform X3 [Capsicum annuum]